MIENENIKEPEYQVLYVEFIDNRSGKIKNMPYEYDVNEQSEEEAIAFLVDEFEHSTDAELIKIYDMITNAGGHVVWMKEEAEVEDTFVEDSDELVNDISESLNLAKQLSQAKTNAEEKEIYKKLYDLIEKICDNSDKEIEAAKDENKIAVKESICKRLKSLSNKLNVLSDEAKNQSARAKLLALSKEVYRYYDKNRKYLKDSINEYILTIPQKYAYVNFFEEEMDQISLLEMFDKEWIITNDKSKDIYNSEEPYILLIDDKYQDGLTEYGFKEIMKTTKIPFENEVDLDEIDLEDLEDLEDL